MRWFGILIVAVVIAGLALAVERLTNWGRPAHIQFIVALALVVIVVSLLGFVSRLRD